VRIHLVNPSHVSFGVAVITPRWLYVLAEATPRRWGDPLVSDETLEPLDEARVARGDVVGIGIHTGNALRGYEVGRRARARGAWVVFGGIHASLYPTEAHELGGAHAVVRGDGDRIWAQVLEDCARGTPARVYEAGRVDAAALLPGRWDLLPRGRYMWASVQTVRGCPKHCSFCSVWRTDGQQVRQRPVDAVVGEVVTLRRMGFRFVALADDNFYPVTFGDLAQAARRRDGRDRARLEASRAERFDLMARLAALPDDTVFFTQITMEAAEDETFLEAMRRAHIRGALVGIEAVTPEGLKDVSKGFNLAGDALVARLKTFRRHDIHVLGSFIFGLPSDRPETFAATAALAEQAELTFAQFVMLTPFPGTVDFDRWERSWANEPIPAVGGVPLTRHWLIPQAQRPKVYLAHPTMAPEELRARTQAVWDRFYCLRQIWARARAVRSWRGRLAFVLVSKLYRQMYANTGIATDSARHARAERWARWLARPCRRLFAGRPLPDLTVP
jgi:tRNA A37 methylthiotransferase MiaB